MWPVFVLFILVGAIQVGAVGEDAKERSGAGTSPSNSTDDGLLYTTSDTPDCENNTCVRKCCGKGLVFSLAKPHYLCTEPLEGEPRFEVTVKHKDGRPANSPKPLLILLGFPNEVGNNCSTAALPAHRQGHIITNSSFFTAHDNEYRGHTEYCIEVYRQEKEPTKLTAFTCYTQFVETTRTLFRYYAHSICLTASCIALIVVVLCHVFIPKLRDLQGRCLLSHVCSLLVGNIALLAATLWQSFSSWQCITIGIVLHTAFIATYMWLTVMCFDIWRFVRMSVQGIPVQHLIGGEKKMFLTYSAAAWGVTAVIAVVTCTLQFLPEDALPDYVIRPHFGVNRCFIIEDDANLFVYFFLILGSLCLVNVCLVCKTAHYLYGRGLVVCRCCRPRKDEDTESAVFNAKYLDIFWQRFQIFILTIVVWATEVLSFKIPPKEMWELTDLLNTLQGVFILVIFMRQQKKRVMVLEKLRNVTHRAQEAVQKITISDETTTTLVSNTFSEKLPGSDQETVDRIRKLSRQQETVGSTIVKSISRNKVDLISMKALQKASQEEGRKDVDNTGFESDVKQTFVDVDLTDRKDTHGDSAKEAVSKGP